MSIQDSVKDLLSDKACLVMSTQDSVKDLLADKACLAIATTFELFIVLSLNYFNKLKTFGLLPGLKFPCC